MTKPTSKVIQITSTALQLKSTDFHKSQVINALCEDGSIWAIDGIEKTWVCILEAPEKLNSN